MMQKISFREWLVGVIIIGGVFVADRWGGLAPVKSVVEGGVAPLRSMVMVAARPGAEILQGVRFMRSGVGRIADLERENARLRVMEEKVRAVEAENEAFRQKASWGKTLSPPQVLGRVIGVSGDLLVDKGKREGLAEGMVAVSPEGVLVGKVVAVGEWTSRIRLPIDQNSRMAVRVGNQQVKGVLRGTGGGLLLDEVVQADVISEGESVVTAGTDGQYPAGILIGRLGKILPGGAAVYQKADVNQIISYDKVIYLYFL